MLFRSTIPSSSTPLSLRNVLIAPHIIKNLISVRQFTTDNFCTVEFDPFGFSVKALPSKTEILRCNSSGPLYPLCQPSTNAAFTAATTTSLWHCRLGHPGHHTMSRLHQAKSISSSNKDGPSLCHACQLGKHVRLPFYDSQTYTIRP